MTPDPSDPFDRGHVVWHDGPFRDSGRPWLVLTADRHPFHGEEYLVASITTTERAQTIALASGDWAVGGLPRPSYVAPWFLTTLRHESIDRGVGALGTEATRTACRDATEFID